MEYTAIINKHKQNIVNTLGKLIKLFLDKKSGVNWFCKLYLTNIIS